MLFVRAGLALPMNFIVGAGLGLPSGLPEIAGGASPAPTNRVRVWLALPIDYVVGARLALPDTVGGGASPAPTTRQNK